MTQHRTLKALSLSTALVGMSAGVLAAQESDPGKWQWDAMIYFWAASIGGETVTGEDVDIGIDSLLKNFNMGAMGTLSAKKDKLSFFGDFIYLDVGNSQSINGNLIGNPFKLKADLDVKGFISTFGVGYNVYETAETTIDVIGGGRYLQLDTDIKFSLGGGGSRRFSSSDSALDGIVGLRGQSQINDSWYVDYYADVGAGQSDLTWQVAAGFGYRFEKFDVAFGYRYIDWDLNDFAPFDNLNFHGPYLGAKFHF